jgi:polysaccharide biosynthesis protein PslH
MGLYGRADGACHGIRRVRNARIIIVMPDLPLPFGNAAARWFYVLFKGLVERGHDVTALAACSKPDDIEPAKSLFPATAFDLRCFPHQRWAGLSAKLRMIRQPYSYVYSHEMRQTLAAELSRGFDILHLEQLWSGWLGLDRIKQALLNVHYLFSIDLADTPTRTLAERIRRMNALRAERSLLRRFSNISTLSPRLSSAVQTANPGARVYTVPLGLDLSLYPFLENPPEHESPVLSLVGSFNWQPTYSAGQRLMTRLWPQIKQRVPHARLQLVGRCAHQRFQHYEALPDVTIHEDVPDTKPYFYGSDVMLYAPSAGSGMKVKVMEAFAYGTPVVTNPDGVEGMPAVDGMHAGIAEDDAGLIERAVELLRRPDRRATQRSAARELLEQHCSPGVTLNQLESVYAGMATKPPQGLDQRRGSISPAGSNAHSTFSAVGRGNADIRGR